MPYSHAGEIGDVWKHYPLCDILKIETPARYFETNGAFPQYTLPDMPRKEFGVFRFYQHFQGSKDANSSYLTLLESNGLTTTRTYYGSPALAMTLLAAKETEFYFHDIEREPLSEIDRFATKAEISDRTYSHCGDSIACFLRGDYTFGENDFVFIDPYSIFDANEAGQSFFDVFQYVSLKAKTLLWYGFESLYQRQTILQRLSELAKTEQRTVHTFDLWLRAMNAGSCPINPGVPGCGLSAVNLSDESLETLKNALKNVCAAYEDSLFEGVDGSLDSEISEFS